MDISMLPANSNLQEIKSREYRSWKSSCYSITSGNSYHNFFPLLSSLSLSFVARVMTQIKKKQHQNKNKTC